MASLKTCIKRGLEKGTMTPKTARNLAWEYDQWIRAADDGGKVAARHLAEARAMKSYTEKLMNQKRRALLMAAVKQEISDNLKNHPKNPAAAGMAMLAKDLYAKAGYGNVDKRTQNLMAQFNSLWADSLSSMQTTRLGWAQDRALIRDTMLEIHGKDTGNARAKENAAGWKAVSMFARDLFNDAGGNIKYRADWFSPQFHDRLRISNAGPDSGGPLSRDSWKKFITPLLDVTKMVDPITGRPFNPKKLPKVLDEIFNEIVTGQHTRRYARSFDKRHTDARFLAFKDADAWMTYQEKFGEADQHRALTNHLRGMAREIAGMQVFGPDTVHGYEFMRKEVGKYLQSKPAKKLFGYQLGAGGYNGEARLRQMDHVYDVVMGNLHPASVTHAQLYGSLQAYLSGSKLGSAVISALSDFQFLSHAASWSDLNAVRLTNSYFKMIGGGEEARIAATRICGAAHTWLAHSMESDRFAIGDGLTPYGVTGALHTWTRRFSETVIRASGLEAHTVGARGAFGYEFMATLGDHAHQTLDEIAKESPGLRRSMAAHGLRDSDWNYAREYGLIDFNGVKFISLEQLLKDPPSPVGRVGASRAATALMDMVETEMDYAIPVPDARVRGHLTQGTAPGTLLGTLLRAGTLFKSFPATVIYTQWARGILQTESAGEAGAYLARMILGTTLFGGIAYQGKQLVAGRDPVSANPWTHPAFLGQAFVQGGGGSIMADFMAGGINAGRHGNSFAAVLAGPILGTGVEDVHSITLAQLGLLTSYENPQIARSAVEFARKYNPGASLLYTRLALDRLLFDNLSAWANPSKFTRSASAKEQYAQGLGTAYFWPPGSDKPRRAPDFFGGSR